MKAGPEFWGIIDRTEVQQNDRRKKNRSLLLHANGGGKGIVFLIILVALKRAGWFG
jgi:hypothetical protein